MALKTALTTLATVSFLFLSGCASDKGPKADTRSPVQRSIDNTYDESTILGEARKHFGKGAESIAAAVEKVFSRLGRPNGYIVGTEGSGSLMVGLKAGEGSLIHRIEGEKPVYWVGPSLGFETGANVSQVFALVYNLYDTEDLYARFPALEGNAYLVGGASVSYHQRDEIIVVPIRLGVGLRLGGNINYIKFTKERSYNPF